MNELRSQIRRCMHDFLVEGASFRANFIFGEDFIGFKGHFPGRPVLPGVCKVQAVVVMAEAARDQALRVDELTEVKFFKPVSVGEKIEIACEGSSQGKLFCVQAEVRAGGQKSARLKLKLKAHDDATA